MKNNNHMSDRGQGFIFDAIVGGALLIAAVTLTIYTMGLPPQDVTDPSDNAIETEVKKDMNGVLEASEQDGSLKATVLSWKNKSTGADSYSIAGGDPNVTSYPVTPDNTFGKRISSIGDKYDLDYEVIALPHSNASMPNTRPTPITIYSQVSGGVTSSFAISKTIQLHDRDTMRSLPESHDSYSLPTVSGATGDVQLQNLPADATFPIPEGEDSVVGDRTYNRVDVKVVIYE